MRVGDVPHKCSIQCIVSQLLDLLFEGVGRWLVVLDGVDIAGGA